MAYRCQSCFQRGHNTRTCPRITERRQESFQRRLADCKAQGIDPKEDRHLQYYADEVGERTGVNPLTGAKHKKTGTEQRRCSYCKYKHGSWCEEGLGHTRRTCEELQVDIAKDRVINGEYRRKVLARMKADGIGPGMLVRVRKSGWGEDMKFSTNLVSSIWWEQISYHNRNGYAAIQLKELSADGGRGQQSLPLPQMEIERHTDPDSTIHFGARWSVESDDDAHIQCLAIAPTASLTPPADWFDGRCAKMESRYSEFKG